MSSEKDLLANVIKYLGELGFTEKMINKEWTIHANNRLEKTYFSVHLRAKLIISITVLTHEINGFEIISANKDAKDSNAPFFIITDGKKFKWYKTNHKDDYIDRTRRRKLQDFIPKIEEVQDEIFTFLYKKHLEDNSFYFQIRQNPSIKSINEKYWLEGNDLFLSFSLWANSNIGVNPTSYITLQVTMAGSMDLAFFTRTSNKILSFTKQLAPILDLKPLENKTGEINFYLKNYYKNWQGDYIQVLEQFIKTEKVTIDNAILVETRIKNKDLDGLDIITKKDFEKNLEWVWKYRKKPQKSTLDINYANHQIIPQSLELTNIGHYKHLKLDISSRITCLFGGNGIGKTTVLRALLIALTGTETSIVDMSSLSFQRMLKIWDVNEEGFMRYAPNGNITLNYSHNGDCASSINFILQNNNVHIENHNTVHLPSFTNVSDRDYFTQLIIGFSQIQNHQSQTSKEKGLNKIKKANIQDVAPLLLNIEDSRFEDLSDWIIGLYAQSLENNNQEEKEILNKIFDIISDITGSWISLNKVNFIDRIIWVSLDNQSIPFSLLSQGYKNVFAWIGHFIKRMAETNGYSNNFMQANAILVIDEIDTYLHPKWQRNILNVLAKNFTGTRFIVTTHSPLVANYLEEKDSSIYILGKENAEKVTHVYGRELSYIFRKLMSIEDRPQELQEKIDTLFDWLDEDSKESMTKARELFKELSDQLSEEDSDLIQAKTYLELSEYQ